VRAERSRWWNPDWDSDTSLQESAQPRWIFASTFFGVTGGTGRCAHDVLAHFVASAVISVGLLSRDGTRKIKSPEPPYHLNHAASAGNSACKHGPAQGHIFTILYNLVVTTTDQVGPDGDACGVATAGQNMRLTAGPDRPPGGPAYAAASAASV